MESIPDKTDKVQSECAFYEVTYRASRDPFLPVLSDTFFARDEDHAEDLLKIRHGAKVYMHRAVLLMGEPLKRFHIKQRVALKGGAL